MRILIVSQNYAPETTSVGPFTTGLAEHFASAGHDSAVATTFPHFPQWTWLDGTRRLRTINVSNRVHVRRWRVVLPRRPGSTAWRLTFDLSFGVGMVLNCIGVDLPDVVICNSPPLESAFAGIVLGKLRRRPFVILVQDLPVQAALAVGMLKAGRLTRAALALEGALYRSATRVVTISDRFAGPLTDLGVAAGTIRYIPNWVDTDAFRPQDPAQSMRSRLGAGPDDFLVLHAGNLGQKQALSHVVEAADSFFNNSKMKFAVVGDGPRASSLKTEIARRRVSSIGLFPLIPSEEVPLMLASADALLISQRATVVDSVLPSKALSYMACGRPIVAAVDSQSATADLVRSAECGIVVAPEDAEALANGVRQLQHDPEMGRRMGSNGRRYAIERFSKEAVLSQWDELVAELVAERVRRPE